MSKQTGDFHLKVMLAGEPATVRSACNERLIPYVERAAIRHHWRLSFARSPSHASSGIVELGTISRDTKADAESALSRISDQMEARDAAYARQLIDEVHRAIVNRAAIEP